MTEQAVLEQIQQLGMTLVGGMIVGAIVTATGIAVLLIWVKALYDIYKAWRERRHPKRCHICGTDDGLCKADGWCHDCYEGVHKYLNGYEKCHICGIDKGINNEGFCEACEFAVDLLRPVREEQNAS